MTENFYQALNQWSTRPDDQRFWTIGEMLVQTRHYRESAREATTELSSLKLQVNAKDNLEIVGLSGIPASVTHHTFGQLSRTVGAPADYLRKLPAQLAAVNVNVGLHNSEASANLLIHSNDSLILSAVATDSYTRIWDYDIVERLTALESYGWRVPPARPVHADQTSARKATAADVLLCSSHPGMGIKEGDMIAPSGLYASDHDMFAFLVNEDRRINDGTADGMSRGSFISNSEVANGRALKITMFLYRHVCGNHIVWNASDVNEIKICHRGDANERFDAGLTAELRKYADASAAEDESRITQSQRYSLGGTKADVLDTLFKGLRGDISRKSLESGYDFAENASHSDRTIDPRTAWGMTQGLTAYSQTMPYAETRNAIDLAAGKVLSMAF